MALELRSEGRADVRAGEEFASQVRSFRARYDQLIETLGNLGTEVMRDRTLETDLDIAPNNFVRHAAHGFIFPPQPEIAVETTSGNIPGTEPYTLHYETATAAYDDSKVEAHLLLTYDDAGNAPNLQVREEGTKPSAITPEISTALDAAFPKPV